MEKIAATVDQKSIATGVDTAGATSDVSYSLYGLRPMVNNGHLRQQRQEKRHNA